MTDRELLESAAPADGLGVAVLVDGAVVAWFAEIDEYAEDFCRENWFGRWLTASDLSCMLMMCVMRWTVTVSTQP